MAPDRGPNNDDEIADVNDVSSQGDELELSHPSGPTASNELQLGHHLTRDTLEPQSFTLRGLFLGLAIGVIIVFSNTYFGLQTGWISGMSMPSALIGYAVFKTLDSRLRLPFSPVENVLIQTVASSAGTMPLGCGFVGVIPALEYLLKPEENGPLNLSLGKLCAWAIGICLFGVVFAVPLRYEFIIRQKLKFPSGTATALIISVLHGDKEDASIVKQDIKDHADPGDQREDDESRTLVGSDYQSEQGRIESDFTHNSALEPSHSLEDGKVDWKEKIKLLLVAFAGSALYVCASPFPA